MFNSDANVKNISSPKKLEAKLSCPKCSAKTVIKSGLVNGEQRWKCKECTYQYTRTKKRGRPLWQKSLVVFLYSYGVSMHAIARIFDVQPSTILKWVREYAKDHVHKPENSDVHIMTLAEMQSLMQKNVSNDQSMLCISINDDIFKDGAGIIINKNTA